MYKTFGNNLPFFVKMNITKKLQNLALCSRILVLIIQYISNIIIPDHNAHVFLYPKTNDQDTSLNKIILHLLEGFVRWDSQYFMHIARYGYTYENNLAFFPLYPFLIRLISLTLYSIFPFISLDSTILLVFIILNSVIFILAVKLLYRLTVIIFNEKIAYKSSILFCFNPASIFFTAPYSECLFSYLTFYSILNCLLLYKKYSNPYNKMIYGDMMYLVPIILSTITRSNGTLNVGFLAYSCICIYYKHNMGTSITVKLKLFIKYLFIISSLLIACFSPFIMFQIYSYKMFCTDFETTLPENIIAYAKENDFILPGQFSTYNQSWCYDKIPLAYAYVQNHYWNVGFLRYYTLRKIPNFLLAIPTLYIVTTFCYQHIKYNFSINIMDLFTFNKLFEKKIVRGYYGAQLNVFVVHAIILLISCVLFIHIEVTTRMLCSATPVFYWSCAIMLKDIHFSSFKETFMRGSLEHRLIMLYFFSYFVTGTILFSNFLPWT